MIAPESPPELDELRAENASLRVLLLSAQEDLRRSRIAGDDALRRSEALFRVVVEKSSDAISLTTADGKTRYLTPSVARVLGWTAEEMKTRTPRDQVIPEDQARIATELEHLARSGTRDMSMEFRVRHRDGSIRWIESLGTNLLDDLDVAAIVGSYRDITSRKASEEALRISEERYRRIIENTSEGVWLCDGSYETTFVNQRMADMLGYARDEIVGRPVFLFLTEEGVERAKVRFARRAAGLSETYQNSYRKKDGTTLWALAKTNPIFDQSGTFVGSVGLLTDMTQGRASEEARTRLAAIVESSEDAILSVDLNGTIESWNRGAERLYQYSAAAAVGRSVFLIVPEAIRDDERQILERASRGEALGMHMTRRLRQDGTDVEVALTLSPIRDDAGIVIGSSMIERDLTARRQIEGALRDKEEQFRQAQKMEAVGRLAGGVAHDFNNLLSVILSYTEMAIDALGPGHPMRADFEEIQTAGRQATELTRQLLAFSRQQVLEPRVINVGEIVAGMERMLGRLLGEDVELTVLSGNGVGRVLADPGQIEQVVMNLAVNARDAMPDGGKLTIEMANVEFDADAGARAGVRSGHYVFLAISDTGSGMDATTAARVFEPFFTTKAKGKGTGLGLATVFGIVKQSGGHIGVYSEPGVGTTFKVYLPRTDRTADALKPSGTQRVLLGSETILLVEDAEQVRTVAALILRRHGYHVLETSNGGEASLASKAYPSNIDLLFTDVVMPGMSGAKLAEELGTQRPGMRVLFASGYTDDDIVHRGVLESGGGFLQKPFTPDALLRKVREALDAPRLRAQENGSR